MNAPIGQVHRVGNLIETDMRLREVTLLRLRTGESVVVRLATGFWDAVGDVGYDTKQGRKFRCMRKTDGYGPSLWYEEEIYAIDRDPWEEIDRRGFEEDA